jgi:hypothetical protein
LRLLRFEVLDVVVNCERQHGIETRIFISQHRTGDDTVRAFSQRADYGIPNPGFAVFLDLVDDRLGRLRKQRVNLWFNSLLRQRLKTRCIRQLAVSRNTNTNTVRDGLEIRQHSLVTSFFSPPTL